jgi:pilus assembly protein CpaF
MSTANLFRFGALDRWLHDPDVSEVMVNAGRHVWIERADAARGTQYVGELEPGALDAVVERMLAPVGRRLDRANPVVDARLPDGSRMCAVLSPVAVDGTCLSVRRFAGTVRTVAHFAPPALHPLLAEVVRRRCNVLVSGATSSGKTTLLNALATFVGAHERVVTLEDTAELRLEAPHVLRLETRPATADGVREVGLDALVRAALRLRPDRLIVGEIRGVEAFELVQALSTGHDGSLATMHANSAADALARLEALVLRANPGWPLTAVRELVWRSIDVVVHLGRGPSGVRGVRQVIEVAASVDATHTVLATHDATTSSLTRARA